MQPLITLLEMARAKFDTDAALARRIGVPQHHPIEWRKGLRAISPETAAMLCDVLELPGEEAREWVALAVIQNPKNAGKAEVLRRALFACWVLGVGSLATHSKDAAAQIGLLNQRPAVRAICTDVTGPKPTLCTLSRMACAWLRGAVQGLLAWSVGSPAGNLRAVPAH